MRPLLAPLQGASVGRPSNRWCRPLRALNHRLQAGIPSGCAGRKRRIRLCLHNSPFSLRGDDPVPFYHAWDYREALHKQRHQAVEFGNGPSNPGMTTPSWHALPCKLKVCQPRRWCRPPCGRRSSAFEGRDTLPVPHDPGGVTACSRWLRGAPQGTPTPPERFPSRDCTPKGVPPLR